MNIMDQITEATNRYTRKNIIDGIFQGSPLLNSFRKDTNEWLISNDPDPFETFVRETRAAAGITDPPRQPVCGGGRSQPYWHGQQPFKKLDASGLTPEDYDLDES